MVAAVVQRWGRLDVLINGAAGNFLVATEDLSVNGYRTGALRHTSLVMSCCDSHPLQ